MQMIDDSPEYYRLRESQERDAAGKAPTHEIANIHLALAAKYHELALKAAKRA